MKVSYKIVYFGNRCDHVKEYADDVLLATYKVAYFDDRSALYRIYPHQNGFYRSNPKVPYVSKFVSLLRDNVIFERN